jgi:hypothetical protein
MSRSRSATSRNIDAALLDALDKVRATLVKNVI